jgi:hypothetical protein
MIGCLSDTIQVFKGPKKKLPTTDARNQYLTSLCLMPCLICFLAFTRPFIYRFFWRPAEMDGISLKCSKFGWLNNASVRITCDNRPLDIHATLAISWLVLFSVQTITKKFRWKEVHKFIGWTFGFMAAINVVGMLQFAIYDIVSPMKTERPPVFTPFMFMTAVIISWCLYESYQGIIAKNFDHHGLWMARAFLMSFTTPVIRFYPIVLRYIFSTACIKDEQALDTWVLGSMTVASSFTLYLFYLANRACRDETFDNFLWMFIAFEAVALIMDGYQTYHKGTFFGHMYRCWKNGDAGDTVFTKCPVHPLLVVGFVASFFMWIFVVLVGHLHHFDEEGGDDGDDDDKGLSVMTERAPLLLHNEKSESVITNTSMSINTYL